MTLILTALTPRFVVMVSDRRLSAAGPLPGLFVKAVVTPRFACAYTGVAELGADRDTGKWIAKTLMGHDDDPDGGLEHLRASLESEFKKVRYARHLHAVVCAAWEFAQGPFMAQPALFAVTNFSSALHRRPTVEPFTVQRLLPGSMRTSSIFPIGASMCSDEYFAVSRSVERLCRSGRDSIRAIAELLTEAIRGVSRRPARTCARCPLGPKGCRRPPSTVSEDVLVVGIPRQVKGDPIVGHQVDDFLSVTGIRAGPYRIAMPGGPLIVGYGDGVIRPAEAHERMRRNGSEKDSFVAALQVVVPPTEGTGGIRVGLLDDADGEATIPMWFFPGSNRDGSRRGTATQ